MRYKEANTGTVRGTRVNSIGPSHKVEAPPKKVEPVAPTAFVVQYLMLDHGMKVTEAMEVADVADEVCSRGGSLRRLRKSLKAHLDDLQIHKALWKIQGIYEARARA